LLPKAEHAAQVSAVAQTIAKLASAQGLASVPALALLVETPLGVHNVGELAKVPEIVALVFGSEDYSAILGVRPTPEAMLVPAQHVAMAARAYGLAAWGVPGTIVDIADTELLARVAHSARQIGFTGTIAINPRQVPIFNTAFGISEEEIAWARETIEVFEAATKQGRAAVAHKGRMIDTPVAVRAKLLLDRSRKHAGSGVA
jgi:citrate lyase subunit beta/citryl-CoA lyase